MKSPLITTIICNFIKKVNSNFIKSFLKNLAIVLLRSKILILEKIVNEKYSSLNASERHACKFFLSNILEVSGMSMDKLAEGCALSRTSLFRLVNKLGFESFNEFKFKIKQDISEVDDFQIHMDAIDAQSREIELTHKLLRTVDFDAIVHALTSAEHIYGFGTGSGQQNALRDFNRSLISIGKNIMRVPALKELDLILRNVTSRDMLIIVSLSGETESLKERVLTLINRGVPILAFTTFGSNFLAQHATFNIHYYTTEISKHDDARLISLLGLNIACDVLYRKIAGYLVE